MSVQMHLFFSYKIEREIYESRLFGLKLQYSASASVKINTFCFYHFLLCSATLLHALSSTLGSTHCEIKINDNAQTEMAEILCG